MRHSSDQITLHYSSYVRSLYLIAHSSRSFLCFDVRNGLQRAYRLISWTSLHRRVQGRDPIWTCKHITSHNITSHNHVYKLVSSTSNVTFVLLTSLASLQAFQEKLGASKVDTVTNLALSLSDPYLREYPTNASTSEHHVHLAEALTFISDIEKAADFLYIAGKTVFWVSAFKAELDKLMDNDEWATQKRPG